MFGIILLLHRFWFCSLSNKIVDVTNGTTFTERIIPIFVVSFMRDFNVLCYVYTCSFRYVFHSDTALAKNRSLHGSAKHTFR